MPPSTLERYVQVRDAAQIRASTALDGLPQRMIDNDFLLRLEHAGALYRILIAIANAWKWKAHTGMTIGHMISTFFQAMKSGDSISQTLMAANAPVIIQRAMVEGKPDEGVLPSGQVASVIGELLSCREMIEGIVLLAAERADVLAQLANRTQEKAA